jgi:hypothetical protein
MYENIDIHACPESGKLLGSVIYVTEFKGRSWVSGVSGQPKIGRSEHHKCAAATRVLGG